MVALVLCSSPLTTAAAWGGLPGALRARRVPTTAVSAHGDDQAPFAVRWVASCARQVAELPAGPVVLVGHSGAGPLLAQLGFALRSVHRRTAAYAFLDAGLPQSTPSSRLDAFRREDAAGAAELERLLRSGESVPRWDVDDLAEVPRRADRQRIVAAVRPRGLAYWTEPLPTPTDFPDAPCVYLQTSAGYAVAARTAAAHGWDTRWLGLGHFPGFVDPDAAAEALLGLLGPYVPDLTEVTDPGTRGEAVEGG